MCPCPTRAHSWEPATVLLSSPTDAIKVAEIESFDYDAVLDDCLHVIPDSDANSALRASWRTWVGQRPRSVEDVRARFAHTLPKPPPKRPAALPSAPSRTLPGGLSASAIVMTQPATVTSSRSAGAEGAAQRTDAAVYRAETEAKAAAAQVTMDALVPSDFVMAKMSDDQSASRIPWLVVQLPASFGGRDTTDPELSLKVKWWIFGNGKYSGDVIPWTDENGAQYDGAVHGDVSCIDRGAIELTGVKFTQAEPNERTGGYKLNAATKRRVQASSALSKWEKFK